MSVPNTDSELPSIEGIYPTLANATEPITFSLPSATVGTYPIVLNIPYAGIISAVSVKSSGGSGTISILIDGVAATGLSAVTINSTEAVYSPSDLNDFIVGQDITLSVVSASSLLNLTVTVSIIRGATSTTAAVTVVTPTALSILEPLAVVLPAATTLIPVTFAATKLDANGDSTVNYRINPEPLEDLTGSPTEVVSYTIVGKTSTGLSLVLSGPLTSTTMVFRAMIATDASATDILSAGGSSGSGGATIASTTLPLRGDGAGGGVAVTQQTGDIASALLAQNLMTGTPTLGASSLTGTITQARLGSGSAGGGSKFLADDQTYKTPSAATATGTGFPHMTSGVQDPAAKLVVNSDVDPAAAIVQSKINFNGVTPTGWRGSTSTTFATGNDARIAGALQTANNLSEFALVTEFVRINLGLTDIVLKDPPGGAVAGDTDVQVLTNKTMDGGSNTFTNISISSIADSVHTTLSLLDPGADKLAMWNDTTNLWDWCGAGYGASISGATPNKQFNSVSAINSKSADYTLVLTDAEKTIYHPDSDNNARAFTIPANASVAYPIGTRLNFCNDKNTLTIAINSDTMVLSGGTSTGSRTLATTGNATAQKVATARWIIWGTNLT